MKITHRLIALGVATTLFLAGTVGSSAFARDILSLASAQKTEPQHMLRNREKIQTPLGIVRGAEPSAGKSSLAIPDSSLHR